MPISYMIPKLANTLNKKIRESVRRRICVTRTDQRTSPLCTEVGYSFSGKGGGAILCVLKGIVTVWTRCKVDQQILLLCTE